MSDADRSQYSDEVTQFSENEPQQLLEIAVQPVALLGGWATNQLALKSGTLNVNGDYTPAELPG